MMIAGVFALWLVFQTCGKISTRGKKIAAKLPPNCRLPVGESNQENNIRAPTPTEAALVGIAH